MSRNSGMPRLPLSQGARRCRVAKSMATSMATPLLSLSVMLALSACQSTSPQSVQQQSANTATILSDLAIQPVTVTPTDIAAVPVSQIRDGYASLSNKLEDPALTRDLKLRLADVEMLVAEEQQMTGAEDYQPATGWQRAIDAYEQLLKQYPDQSSQGELLYQLSRAYELQGDREHSAAVLARLLTEHPESLHASEAWFRRGEAFYSAGDYAAASKAYSQVLKRTTDSPFYTISAYMLGWAQFKLEQYQGALRAFDALLSASFSGASEDNDAALPQPDTLPVGQRKLVNDSLRVMALLFSYQGNGQAIVNFYAGKEHAPHGYLVYQQLAQHYLNQDRYQDAADAYLAFARHHLHHPLAVDFYVKHVDAYLLGNFPSQTLVAKRSFVDTFGSVNGLWEQVPAADQVRAAPYLHQYLKELAQTYHSLAQSYSNPTRQDELSAQSHAPGNAERLARQAEAYQSAARYYREFLNLFRQDPQYADMQFYLAESLYEASKYAEAIEAYQEFAYKNPNHPNAADGAYTALLALREGLASGQLATEPWLNAQRKSQRQFVESFSQDPRVVAVARTLMQNRFDARDYPQSLYWSRWLLARAEQDTRNTGGEVRRSAALVEAYSLYGQQDFIAASQSFKPLMASLSASDPKRGDVVDAYAISLFRQAESAVAAQQLPLAVEFYRQIIEQTPNTPTRLNAQFDATTHLLALKRYDEALPLLQDFAARFANHPLAQQIPTRLLYLYEQTGQWEAAATILLARWQAEPDSQSGRESLWSAAGYFEQAGDRAQALNAYRSYAHRYPQPFEQATEARFTLSEFYRHSGEDDKRRYWLNKLMLAQDQAGEFSTVRSRTLAAQAATVFADDARVNFLNIKLTAPLKTSLSRKRQALEVAMERLDRVMGYGVREFTTQANHHLGELYLDLAQALMGSERPTGLNAMEQMQYDILLEEQAFPFEEQAISVLESNAQRSWQGVYDRWVAQSFATLAQLLPARFDKAEQQEELSDADF